MSHSDAIHTDVLVIGGGPAGLCAGIEAMKLGVEALIIDDKNRPGGQLIKQKHMFFGSKNEMAGVRGYDIALQLIDEYKRLGGGMLTGTFAVGIYEDGIVGAVRNDSEFIKIIPRKIVIATGAYENMLRFPNCDMPGVYGAGGFQTLMNIDGVLPGKKVLMVGAGNIGLIVSYQLMQAGGEVVAIVEARHEVGGYDVHAAKVKRMGVPILLSHSIKSVGGRDRVEYATIVKLNRFREVPGSEFTVEVDTVCLSVGLSPLVELAATAGCEMKYIPSLGGWVPWHDENMMTSRPDVYVAGDNSGIEEASAAMIQGRIAGCNAAAGIQGREVYREITQFHEQLAALRKGPFGAKVWQGKGELIGRTFDHGKLKPAPKPPEVDLSFTGGKRVIIECHQNIPCNPCMDACRAGAVIVGPDIVDLPVYNSAVCNDCKQCLVKCPGLAMFYMDMDYSAEAAEITIAYELLPVPGKGETWWAVGRNGEFLCETEITKVVSAKSFDKKHLVSFTVAKKFASKARHIVPVGKTHKLEKLPPRDVTEDPVICRCEDVRQSEIGRAIDAGHHSFEELKRVLRIGMGPCQGKTCQALVQRMLSEKLHKPLSKLKPMTTRAPLKPISLDVMSRVSTGLPQEDRDG